MKKPLTIVVPLLVMLAAAASPARAQLNPAVMPTSGPLSKQTMTRLLLTDSVRIGNRIVAVGDRGYIVLSNDGENWERAETPANTPLLNAVFFSDPKSGWAVGHDAVILKSADEGKKWTQVYAAPKEQKPLMDILFLDANHGFAVGAYGSFYETTDAGKTWTSRKVAEPPPKPAAPPAKPGKGAKPDSKDLEIDDGKGGDEDRHLNAIVKLGDNRLLIVGEAATLLKSDDAGKTWQRIVSPYKGSFFGAVQAQDGAVVIYGLRGKIFRSTDPALKDWKLVDNKSVASLMGSTRLPDGTIVLSGLAGTVLLSRDNGASFTPLPTGLTKGYAAPLLGASNALLLVGEAGARDVLLSAATPASPPPAPAKP